MKEKLDFATNTHFAANLQRQTLACAQQRDQKESGGGESYKQQRGSCASRNCDIRRCDRRPDADRGAGNETDCRRSSEFGCNGNEGRSGYGGLCPPPGEPHCYHFRLYALKPSSQLRAKTLGLISDTHGLLRPEAIRALAGVQRIIHAGDIGGLEILEKLRSVAPVDAVRGNNDKGPWAKAIPLSLTLELHGVRIHVLHDLKELEPDPMGFDVVVSGHSHKPAITEREGVHFVNPGSAGPRRFRLPVTVGYLDVERGGKFAARILEIV